MRTLETLLLRELPAVPERLSYVREMLAYSLDGGGKRVRPRLCMLFAGAAGGSAANALYFAAAVEYVHTYSLIHDDLPCMDNDDYRRGKPSSHKQFGEANALLAGDSLLTHAFALIARANETGAVGAEAAVRACRELSLLAGAGGMAGGQYLDLYFEGKTPEGDALTETDLLKTGALIEAACVLGCLAGGANEAQIGAARRFARNLGLAFQIKDDLLEYESGEENSDERNGKATYVSVYGAARAAALAAEATAQAEASLGVFGEAGEALRQFAAALLKRDR